MQSLQDLFSNIPEYVSPLHSAYERLMEYLGSIEAIQANELSIFELSMVPQISQAERNSNNYRQALYNGPANSRLNLRDINFSRIRAHIGDNDYV